MFVCCECFVLSGRGLCDELITRPEESYRLWCVVVCDLENLKNEEAMIRVGSQRHKGEKLLSFTTNNSKTRTSSIKFFPTARPYKQQNIGCKVSDRVGYGQDCRLPLGEWDIPLLQIVPTNSGASQPARHWIHVDVSLGRSSRDMKLTTHLHAISSFNINP